MALLDIPMHTTGMVGKELRKDLHLMLLEESSVRTNSRPENFDMISSANILQIPLCAGGLCVQNLSDLKAVRREASGAGHRLSVGVGNFSTFEGSRLGNRNKDQASS